MQQRPNVSLDEEISAGPMTSDDPLPSTVKFYNPYQITWVLNVLWIDGEHEYGNTFDMGTTDNRMYVMFGSTASVYESLGELSCSAADGLSATLEIRDAIWNTVFFGPANPNRKPINGFNVADNEPLKYYGVASPEIGGVSKLLSTGDGRCGGWGDFLVQAWNRHAVASSSLQVSPKLPHIGLAVKEYTLSPNAIPDAEGYYPFTDLVGATGISGQNMETPAKKTFVDHCLAKPVGSTAYYDPSYGRLFADGSAWVAGAVWGLGKVESGQVLMKPNSNFSDDDFNGF